MAKVAHPYIMRDMRPIYLYKVIYKILQGPRQPSQTGVTQVHIRFLGCFCSK